MRLFSTTFPFDVPPAVVSMATPDWLFPEMTLRAALDVPPTVLFEALRIKTPSPVSTLPRVEMFISLEFIPRPKS